MLVPLFSRNPKLFSSLHDIGQHCATEEDHVLPTWRIFNTDLEFLETTNTMVRPSLTVTEVHDTERTLSRVGSPFNTLVRYNCFISFSRRLGRPGYMLEPPERTTCLYSSVRTSTAAFWIVWKSISATPGCSISTR